MSQLSFVSIPKMLVGIQKAHQQFVGRLPFAQSLFQFDIVYDMVSKVNFGAVN